MTVLRNQLGTAKGEQAPSVRAPRPAVVVNTLRGAVPERAPTPVEGFTPAVVKDEPALSAEQLKADSPEEFQVRVLRAALGVPLNGQSANPHVFPISPARQRVVRQMLEAVANDPVQFARLYYRVNGERLLGSLTGENDKAVRALVNAHHASARPGDWEGYFQYLDGLTGSKPVGPNSFDFLVNGEVLPEVRRMLLLAKSSIHLSVFHVQPDEISDALADVLLARAAKGVKVRVMVDEFGTVGLGKAPARALLDRLRAGGVEVVVNGCSRLKTHLDHRKLLVVDGKEGFTGGMNIGHHYQREWLDQQTRIKGPLVAELQRAFLQQWSEQGGATPGADEPLFPTLTPVEGGEVGRIVLHAGRGDDRNIKAAYLRAFQTAEKEIKIATPYFGDEDVVRELCAASARGVKVTLYLPEENNHKIMKRVGESYYQRLIEAGVDVREVPGMSHLKVSTIDRRWCSFGSSNLDARSLEYNDELNCIVASEALAASIEKKLFAFNEARTTSEPPPGPRALDALHRRLAPFV